MVHVTDICIVSDVISDLAPSKASILNCGHEY
jgi:hypothetical protein